MRSEMTSASATAARTAALLRDFSLEMTGKDVPALEAAHGTIPPGTRINVTFLGSEDLVTRVTAAAAVKERGFTPVPHISARRIASQAALEEFLSALQARDASESLFTVAGDPAQPQGPYANALGLLRSGLLKRFGAVSVSVAGYPEGHPEIPDDVLWTALADKAAALDAHGLSGSIITQFGFDADAVLRWTEQVRQRGIPLPVRVGVPGPTGIKRLLSYASRFGVATSAGIARKYGLSLTNLVGTAGPDTFLRDLADGYDSARHGDLRLHFYTFGGLQATAKWITQFSATLAKEQQA
jgi:methylenetetrahydrofolate reductase (NADPH)